MTDPDAARNFLVGEVAALAPFDFVAAGPAGKPLHIVEVTRRKDSALEVRIPGRLPIFPELPVPVRSKLRDLGFASKDAADPTKPWTLEVADATAAVDLLQRILRDVYEEKSDIALDIGHGSHRAEYEALEKLAEVRKRIESVLSEMVGRLPEKDAEDDYLVPVGDVRVMVAPRVAQGGTVVVRIFAITNVGVTVTPELGLFLARLNFGLMFGRFALDAEHQSIWVDETLLGEHLSEEELRFLVGVVASTADEWDDRLKQLFGGGTYQDILTKRTSQELPSRKPGEGGYL